MPVTRIEVSPRTALKMLQHVHRRPKPPQSRAVIELAQQMLAADEAGEPWEQGELRRIVLSEDHPGRPAGVIRGVEVLMAVVYTKRTRPLLVELDAPLKGYLTEVDPEAGPAIAANGTVLDSHLTIGTWADDHRSESTTP